ncbi:MAG: phosphoribosylaminoimidazolesuccinocarboxamide synthase [Candidatus Cloacimonetes bacterium]|nr:phosphoribosylaminoimidazolesuccinocarboxamide synthase [Candidatus Cloacimonadota bacterium]
MICLDRISSPQLQKIHSGKVRESFRLDDETRMIVVTDRISSFDQVLDSCIPHKGAVLNGLAGYWFEKTTGIVENHLLEQIDPNISLVREAEPVRIEMIVRGYLTGSMWRYYAKGKRSFSGISVKDGLQKNQKFPKPLITPTTKEDSDREITPDEIVREGWASREIYEKMTEISLKLFQFGTQLLAEKGIILVDTKYEFGLRKGKLILIDEIHTPDSSRFWSQADYEKDPEKVEQIDKEFVRQWLLANKKNDVYPSVLPDEVIAETSRRYLDIYERITGRRIRTSDHILNRVYQNLVRSGIIKDGFVAIVMGSPADQDHCQRIREELLKYDVAVEMRVVSAHKNGERIPGIVSEYNQALEPGAVIAVAGRSNGLGGALAANLVLPLINCPPFKDKVDMLVNINSSLMMPSGTPAGTVVEPAAAAQLALRSLNLPRLKNIFLKEISDTKTALVNADDKMREGK